MRLATFLKYICLIWIYVLFTQSSNSFSDDIFPGIPIPPSPVLGHLDIYNRMDIYSIYLRHGEKLLAVASFPFELTLYPHIFPPGTSEANEQNNIGFSYWPDAWDEQLKGTSFAPAEDKDGTYSLALEATGGAGDYSLNWRVVPAQPDDAFPGVTAPLSPLTGTLTMDEDICDIYRIHLNEGQSFRQSGGCDLYGPAEPNSGKYWIWPLINWGLEYNYAVPPGKGGYYYILKDLTIESYQYRIDYSVVPADPKENVPGVPLPPSSVLGHLSTATNIYDVYAVNLKTSQTITAWNNDPLSYRGLISFMPPECLDVASYDYAKDFWSFFSENGIENNHVSGVIAPKEGRYYLVVWIGNIGKGEYNYSFRYSKILVSGFSRSGYRLNWMELYPNAYTDRGYLIDYPLPVWCRGRLFIQTKNGDKDLTSSWSFTVDVPVEVVVAINEFGPPEWLKDWKKLNEEMMVSGDPNPRRVLYARAFTAGKITLGGNRDSDMPTGRSMYSVLLLPPRTIPGLTNRTQDWFFYK